MSPYPLKTNKLVKVHALIAATLGNYFNYISVFCSLNTTTNNNQKKKHKRIYSMNFSKLHFLNTHASHL